MHISDTGTALPIHDIRGNLIKLISLDHTLIAKQSFTAFGEDTASSWGFASKRHDPLTGFINFGHRFYDPELGRFIFPDPEEESLNLYQYVFNQPFTQVDLYGLSSSDYNSSERYSRRDDYYPYNYQEELRSASTFILSGIQNPRFQGTMQAFGGFAEMGFGGWMTLTSLGITAPLGIPVFAHGFDHFITGIHTTFTGIPRDTATSQLLQKTGMSREWANCADGTLSIGGSFGGSAAIRFNRLIASPHFRLLGKEPRITLYRAVQPGELADIQKTGIFRNLGDAEGKYFTTSMTDACSYAKKAVKGFGDPPYTLIRTNIPHNILKGIYPTLVDGGIPALVISDQQLEWLIPEILIWMVIPK